ncbi:hypothetical protein KDE13_09105 [Campylobacter sp. faydin G-140]|uniref:hypothetical protein n=1 Tax=Campylobacter anatolicus TaxID=2829105 RepID=UPI001B9037ED|nr:hypothetical protein [Campylobacter anatolicus]MBR8466491.1 hypothetical protein [Campylobacter anatolicus]
MKDNNRLDLTKINFDNCIEAVQNSGQGFKTNESLAIECIREYFTAYGNSEKSLTHYVNNALQVNFTEDDITNIA